MVRHLEITMNIFHDDLHSVFMASSFLELFLPLNSVCDNIDQFPSILDITNACLRFLSLYPERDTESLMYFQGPTEWSSNPREVFLKAVRTRGSQIQSLKLKSYCFVTSLMFIAQDLEFQYPVAHFALVVKNPIFSPFLLYPLSCSLKFFWSLLHVVLVVLARNFVSSQPHINYSLNFLAITWPCL